MASGSSAEKAAQLARSVGFGPPPVAEAVKQVPIGGDALSPCHVLRGALLAEVLLLFQKRSFRDPGTIFRLPWDCVRRTSLGLKNESQELVFPYREAAVGLFLILNVSA